MAYVAPTVRSVGDAVTAADYNIMANDVLDHESRINTSGLTWISTTAVSSGTIISNCFSSTYSNYRMIFNIATSTADNYITFQLRGSGTTRTTSYYSALLAYTAANATNNVSAANAANFYILEQDGATNEAIGGASVDIYGPYLSKYTTYSTTGFSISQGGGYSTFVGGGMLPVSASYDSLVFNSLSGTGTCTIYGYHI